MKLTILALSISASGLAYSAEQTTPPQATSLITSPKVSDKQVETISITGARTPLNMKFVAGAISVIDDAQIQASGAMSVTDLLRTLPSVNISQSGPMGALTEIRFRGSESNHVLIMLDGVEINDLGQGGLIDLSHLMLANISRIEVLRGPQSALWGSSAVAGVISITSKEPDEGNSGNLGVSYGNKNASQIRGAITNRVDNWHYSISASRFDTKGENIARSGNEADGYENTTGYAKLGYAYSKYNNISANLRLVDYESNFDSTDFSTGLIADADNISHGEQMSFGIDWDYSMADSIWTQRLSYQYSEQENQNFSSDVFSGSTKGEKQRLVYNHNFKFTNGHINVGLETVDETFKQSGPITFANPNQKQTNGSASFIADTQWRLGQKLSFGASYRFDNNNKFSNADSYRAGFNYQANDAVRIFASYAEAIKNPTFTERFGFFPGTFLGNAELRPESSQSVEFGVDTQWQNYQIQVSWYRAALQNEILGFVFDSNSGLFSAQNASVDSQREGLEFEISRTIQSWKWSVSYAYLNATEADSVELRRAKHSGSAWLAYEINSAHQFYVQADYMGTRSDRFFPPFPQASEIIRLDNYWLLSSNYRYRYDENLSVSLRISNAFNQAFEDVVGFSGESRRVLFSVDYAW